MKRFIALLMAVILTLTLFSGCSGNNFSFDEDNGDNGGSGSAQYLTRMEWAEMLGRYFGMEECISQEAYFADVPASNAAFSYVQSCTEWGVFNKDEKNFRPNEYATAQFVAESAVIASEVLKGTDETDLFEYARKQGIVEGDADSYVTPKQASAVILWASSAYSNREFVEYENIVVKDTLVEMKDVSCPESGKITLNTAKNDLKVGDVIITAPTPTNPSGVARKITKISTDANGKQVLETTEPAIGDIYDELDFAQVGTAGDASTIIPEDGVKVESVKPSTSASSKKPQMSLLGVQTNKKNTQSAAKGKDLSFNISLGSDGEIAVSQQFGAIEKEISQKPLSEEEKKLAKETFDKFGYLPPTEDDEKTSTKKTDKYDKESGWKLTGTLTLENFYVETELKTKKFLGVPYEFESFSNEVHYKVTNSLSFKGFVKQKIKIATVPVPLAGGLSIDVGLFLELSANGEIKISHTIENTATVKYTKSSGFKKTQETQSSESLEISVNFEVAFGASATLKAFGISIINFEITAAVEVGAAAKLSTALRYEGVLYQYNGALSRLEGVKEEAFFCIDFEINLPKIKLSIGTEPSTLAYKLGIKLTWNIMDKKGATFKCKTIPAHWEYGKGFVDECSLDTMEVLTEEMLDNKTEEDDTTSEDGTTTTVPEEEIPDHNLNSSVFALSQSKVVLSVGDVTEVSVASLPQGYTGRDIRWASDNVSVAIVDEVRATDTTASCIIRATGSGSTCITVTTADQSKELVCAVTVKDDGTIDFNPLKDLPV